MPDRCVRGSGCSREGGGGGAGLLFPGPSDRTVGQRSGRERRDRGSAVCGGGGGEEGGAGRGERGRGEAPPWTEKMEMRGMSPRGNTGAGQSRARSAAPAAQYRALRGDPGVGGSHGEKLGGSARSVPTVARLVGSDEPPPRRAQGEWRDAGTAAAGVPPLEDTSRGLDRGGRKTKRGREYRGGPRRGAGQEGGGPAALGLRGPVRLGSVRPGRRARRSHLHCSSGGALRAAGSALGAALHCSTAGAPSFPAPFSSRRRLSAPGAQTGHGSAPTLRAASPAAAARGSPSRPQPGGTAVGRGTRPAPLCPCRPGLSATGVQ